MERNKDRIARLAIHLTMALTGAWLILVSQVEMATMWLIGAGVGFPIVLLDAFRAYHVWPRVQRIRHAKARRQTTFLRDEQFLAHFEKHYEWWLAHIYHPSEMGRLSSGAWYFMGMVASYWIACAIDKPWLAGFAMLFQGVADPMARIIGLRWPLMTIPEWRGKSLGGFLSAFVASAGVGLCVLALIVPAAYGLPIGRMAFCIGMGAFFAALAEANSRRVGIDDNLIIPVVSMAGMMASLQ